MLAGMSLGTDIKRYSRGAMPRIAICAIILLPLMYGALYLWAFWNPLNEVAKVPAAIVNMDKGTEVQGKKLDAGDQVVDQLISSHQLDLAKVSEQKAKDGIESGEYYFTVTIPENFSAAIASPATGNAQQADITFTYNDANNYLSTVIAQDAAQQVSNKVNAAIGEQTVQQVLSIATQAKPQITEAVDGADELADGLRSANDGAGQLADGANELAENLAVAHTGAEQLAAGTRQLNAAIDTVTGPLLNLTAGTGVLPDGKIDSIADRIGAVMDTLANAPPAGPADTAGRQAPQVPQTPQSESAIQQAIDALNATGSPEASVAADSLEGLLHPAAAQAPTGGAPSAQADDSALAELRSVRTDARNLADALDDPSSPLRRIVATIQDGGLHADLLKLRGAGNELNNGANQLSSGLGELTAGGDQLAQGAVQLHDGTEKLSAGADQLSGGLNKAVGAIPHLSKQQGEDLAKTLGQPVNLAQKNLHPAPTFGAGFAPFFLGLALYVGAIITWMLVTPLQSRAVAGGVGAVRAALASYWPALLIGVLQVVVMYLVVHFAVGLRPVYVWGTFGFLLLIIAAWMSMIQAFNAVFGPAVGRVVTLALLMVMLVSSGGIYPKQTTAKPFQVLNPVDPMNYSVNGLRELTVGGIDHRLWVAIAVLAGITIVGLACTALSAFRDRQYTMQRLYPPIEV